MIMQGPNVSTLAGVALERTMPKDIGHPCGARSAVDAFRQR